MRVFDASTRLLMHTWPPPCASIGNWLSSKHIRASPRRRCVTSAAGTGVIHPRRTRPFPASHVAPARAHALCRPHVHSDRADATFDLAATPARRCILTRAIAIVSRDCSAVQPAANGCNSQDWLNGLRPPQRHRRCIWVDLRPGERLAVTPDKARCVRTHPLRSLLLFGVRGSGQ